MLEIPRDQHRTVIPRLIQHRTVNPAGCLIHLPAHQPKGPAEQKQQNHAADNQIALVKHIPCH
jgi:hypothetical protein